LNPNTASRNLDVVLESGYTVSRLTRLAVALVAVFLTGASCNNGPSPQYEQNLKSPSTMSVAIPIKCGISLGLASPIGPLTALTAEHVVKTDPTCSSFDGTEQFRVVWRNPLLDLAKLELVQGSHFLLYYTVALEQPFDTELLYIRLLWSQEGDMATVVTRYMFTDTDGEGILDGFARQGMSGGPVINRRGELVGITRAVLFPGEKLRALGVMVNLVGRKLD
jgi:hypothetical protein